MALLVLAYMAPPHDFIFTQECPLPSRFGHQKF